MDAAVERTGMYSQGELRSKRGGPGVQRVQKAYVDRLLYSLVFPLTQVFRTRPGSSHQRQYPVYIAV